MKRHWYVVYYCLLTLVADPALGNEATELSGLWVLQDGAAVVEVYEDRQHKDWRVKIVALREPEISITDDEEDPTVPRTDGKNPDASLRDRPLLNLEIGRGFQIGSSGLKRGSIYDPNSGKQYRAEITANKPNVLEVRGYIGFSAFGRTMYWYRLREFQQRSLAMFDQARRGRP